jgi:hypothetical protein
MNSEQNLEPAAEILSRLHGLDRRTIWPDNPDDKKRDVDLSENIPLGISIGNL